MQGVATPALVPPAREGACHGMVLPWKKAAALHPSPRPLPVWNRVTGTPPGAQNTVPHPGGGDEEAGAATYGEARGLQKGAGHQRDGG